MTAVLPPGVSSPQNEPRPKALPPPGKAADDILVKWVDEGLYYGHPLRARDMSRWRRAERYDQGLQWGRRARAGYDEGGSASQWVDAYWGPDDPNWIPTPVFNDGHGARANESARLARPNYRPSVSPRSATPDIKSREGARNMHDMLVHRLDEMEWDIKEAPLIYNHLPIYGGAWWKSEYVLSWDKTVPVPVQTATACLNEECDFTLANKTVGPALAGRFPGLAQGGVPSPKGGLDVTNCPRCLDRPPLLPFKPTMEEAASSRDSIGRPMGEEKPLGDWVLSVPSPYDMFVYNQGLGAGPGRIPDFVHSHVETLDWVALHHPEIADRVMPENAAALAKYHPVAGAPDILGRGVMSGRSFDGCVRVVERHKHPFMERSADEEGKGVWKINRGRSVRRIGKVIALDGDYMVPSLNYPGETIERVLVDYIPWEFRDGGQRLEGISMWDLLFDAQDAENEGISQRQSVRQRMAVPMYLSFREHNFEIQAMAAGVPGRMAVIDAVAEAPTMEPKIINNTTIDQGVSQEIEHSQRSIDRLSGNVEVEKGQVPTAAVSAAQAIAALKTYAGEKRESRLLRIKNSLRRAWGHGARVMEAMYIEPRDCNYEDADGSKRCRPIHGKDFARQTEVEVDAEPDYDVKAKNSAATRDLIQIGVIDPKTLKGTKARAVAKLLDAPEELFEDDDLQRDASEREWICFKEDGYTPQMDPGLDDHSTHYEIHGRACMDQWFLELEKKAGWDGALKVLADDWDIHLQQAALMMPPLPLPGMAPVILPCLQDRVVQMWTQSLMMAGFQPQDPNAMQQVMEWRAHMESHKLHDEMKQIRAQMQPTLAAPGADATMAGNQTTSQAPPEDTAPPGQFSLPGSGQGEPSMPHPPQAPGGQ